MGSQFLECVKTIPTDSPSFTALRDKLLEKETDEMLCTGWGGIVKKILTRIVFVFLKLSANSWVVLFEMYKDTSSKA